MFDVIVNYVLPFLVVFTVLVFVHELGHYLAAVRCGVWVRVFAVGFGSELVGWTDRHGTRWRICALPLGGYVKMFGEMTGNRSELSADELEMRHVPSSRAFHRKSLGQRAFIVFAGPAANFLFAIALLAGMFMTAGQSVTPATVESVIPGSAAERAGFRPGDEIIRIDGTRIDRFEQVARIVQLRPETPLTILVIRNGTEAILSAVPDAVSVPDRNGNPQRFGRLGISRSVAENRLVRHDPLTALWRAGKETVALTGSIFTSLSQIIRGTRGTEELGGPIRIAQVSGDAWQTGVIGVLMFTVLLSINLGLINLFPVPLLDGGYLLIYGIEALRGRPLGERAQNFAFMTGFGMIMLLMVFVSWNDLVQLRLIDQLIELMT